MSVSLVMIEPSRVLEVVDEQIGVAVVVVVDPGAALGVAGRLAFNSGARGDFLERAVTAVAIEAVLLVLACDEKVDPPVVVEVAPRGTVGVSGLEQTGLPGDVGESACA